MSLTHWLSGRVFSAVHNHNLVYNTCWEDPRLDRQALDLGPDDNVLVITSAGCNALDYALCGPNHVYCVDMNPRQNALLELKLAGIRALDFDTFYQLFGNGRFDRAGAVYATHLREHLSPWSQKWWDRWIKFFKGRRRSFYFRGTSGSFAHALNIYFDRVLNMRGAFNDLLDARTLEEQQAIYHDQIEERIWTRSIRFAMQRDATLSLVGVPKAQRHQIDTQYEGGVYQWVRDCFEAVLTMLPLWDNYFWRVYMTGQYTRQCCPEYLKRENFLRLKEGLADRVSTHTDTVEGFLTKHDVPITRFVLLDHMDWLSTHYFSSLESEWQAIVNRAAPNARAIWRSGGLRTDFINDVRVKVRGATTHLSELLTYDRDLAAELHAKDRVHTYGGFYIADLAA